MTKHDLKEMRNLGAELGAAKAENEKLRGLLEAALYYVPSNKTELRALIDAALEHSCKNCEGVQPESCMFAKQAEPTDTYTAVDMATAAAQGFRDGQAAAEQAPAPDWLSSYEAMGDRILAAGWRPDSDAQWDGLRRMHSEYATSIAQSGKFSMHQRVRKTSGSEWQGRICGTYSTALTPEGYAVESEAHAGSVQIYPAKALEAVE